jgi:hydrogenase maturation protease
MDNTALSDSNGGQKFDLLVIGYGNELRGDDGVGPKTAMAVSEWHFPGVHTMVCHQLTPDLAAPIAAAQRVVFVDATADSTGSVELRELAPAGTPQTMEHSANPSFLLGLTKEVFGRSPAAFLLTIPTQSMAFGEELSTQAIEGMQVAVEKIRSLALSHAV